MVVTIKIITWNSLFILTTLAYLDSASFCKSGYLKQNTMDLVFKLVQSHHVCLLFFPRSLISIEIEQKINRFFICFESKEVKSMLLSQLILWRVSQLDGALLSTATNITTWTITAVAWRKT